MAMLNNQMVIGGFFLGLHQTIYSGLKGAHYGGTLDWLHTSFSLADIPTGSM